MAISPSRRGHVFWVGAEGHPRTSRDRSPPKPCRLGLLSVVELRPRALDAGGRNRKAFARGVVGVARREGKQGCVLAIARAGTQAAQPGVGPRGTRFSSAAVRSRAPHFRRLFGCVAERRHRFVDDPALCLASLKLSTEDFLDFVSRTQFRRVQLYPADGRGTVSYTHLTLPTKR